MGVMMKLGTLVEALDVEDFAAVHLHMMDSFRASGVRKPVMPLKCMWLLQHCLALPRWRVIYEPRQVPVGVIV